MVDGQTQKTDVAFMARKCKLVHESIAKKNMHKKVKEFLIHRVSIQHYRSLPFSLGGTELYLGVGTSALGWGHNISKLLKGV